MPIADLSSLVGQTVGGRYRIERSLGAGGMGCVFLARDTRLEDQRVAIKFPLLERFGVEAIRDRWNAEIKDLIDLESHAHIVQIRDKGVHDGIPYFVMAFAAGGSLKDRLASTRGPMKAEVVLTWLEPTAKALDHLHHLPKPVIHRDVKPANILFDGAGNPCLSDFGIAKALDRTAPTKTGSVIGTPSYMAPEAMQTQYPPAYDQYALATTVYECLSGGRFPFESDDPLVLLSIKATSKPIPLTRYAPRLRSQVVDCIVKALDANPARRFESCEKFAEAFRLAIRPFGVPSWLFKTAIVALVLATLVAGVSSVSKCGGPTRVSFSASRPAMIAIAGRAVKMTPCSIDDVPRGEPLRYKVSRPGYETIEGSTTPPPWSWVPPSVRLELKPQCAEASGNSSEETVRVVFDDTVSLKTQVDLTASAGFVQVVGSGCPADATVTGEMGLLVKDNDAKVFAPAIAPGDAEALTRLAGSLQALGIRTSLTTAVGSTSGLSLALSADRNDGASDPARSMELRATADAFPYVRSTRSVHVLMFTLDAEGTIRLLFPQYPFDQDTIEPGKWVLLTGDRFSVVPPTGQLSVFAWSSPQPWISFLDAVEARAIVNSGELFPIWRAGVDPSSPWFARELLRRLPNLGSWSRDVQVVPVK